MRSRLLLVCCIASIGARAEVPGWLQWTVAGPTDALQLGPADAVALPGALLLWGSSLLLAGPANCNWCDGPDNTGLPGSPGSGQASLNGVDAWFHDALTGWPFS